MRFAMLQLNPVTGDIRGNAERLAGAARAAAAAGADLCFTPGHVLCGVGIRRMLTADGFVEACRDALSALAAELAAGPPLLTGAPLMSEDGRICHAAVLINDGVFTPVARTAAAVQAEARPAPDPGRGSVLLKGWRIGLLVWGDEPDALRGHAEAHEPNTPQEEADALVHLGACPFRIGIQSLREQRLSRAASRRHACLFAGNLTGGNGSDVYHGQSLAFGPNGALLGRGRLFEEDCVLVDAAAGAAPPLPEGASREEELWGALRLGLRDYVRKSGFTGVLLGLSGGLDSSVAAAIAVDALGGEQVLGVLLPSPWTSAESTRYACELADNLGIECMELPITPLMRAYAETLAPAFAAPPGAARASRDCTEENIQSRIRGNLLMALANKYGLLLVNTSNKSEIAVGYSTLYGDAAGALAVIGDVYKSDLYRLARWYNVRRGGAGIPEGVIRRAPSAELRPGQLDADSLPPYDRLDPVLARILGEDRVPDVLADAAAPDPALFDEVYEKVRAAEFKRRQFPPALRVSGRAFGRAWRLPLVSRYRL